MRSLVLCALVVASACGSSKASSSTEIKVAAASDLARAFEELGKEFRAETGINPTFTFGSTGLLAKQIEEGAPYDVFAAANIAFVDQVIASGDCDAATKALYARGRIVLWSTGAAPASLEALTDPAIRKIAIANPEHAPYGRAAKEALEKVGIWAQVQPKLVYGENILQTFQYAKSGNVDVAIVALSLAVVADGGTSTAIDAGLHAPLDQALAVCSEGAAGDAARRFAAYVASPKGREIMNRYGFLLPGEGVAGGRGGAGGGGGDGSRPEVPRLDPAAVGAVVDAWLAAQNAGDFAAYEALYADRFGGVKRVGARTWRFDRAGWLADRRRMFEAPMKVELADRAIDVAAASAVVRFRQTFAQGKFKDTGDKQLVVVETPAGLKIAREEMLASTVVDGPGSAKASGFAVLDDGARWLVVGDGAGIATTGALELGGGGTGFERSVRATPADLGERWTRLVGQPVTVYPSGARCTIGGFRVLHLLTPHFGTGAEWGGDADGDGAPERASLEGAALADAIVEAGGAAYLVADIAGCKGGAQDVVGVIGTPAAVWPKLDAPDLAERATAAFRALDEYQALQRDFAQADGGGGPWTGADGGEVLAEVWAAPDGARWAVVAARAGAGCGDFGGELAALFALDGKGAREVAVLPVGAGPLARILVDTNRDGRPELAAHAALWAWDGKRYAPAYELDLGYRDCGC